MKERKKKIIYPVFFVPILVLLAVGISYYFFQSQKESTKKIEASTVVTPGDFWLKVENKWDDVSKSNYAELNWKGTPGASYRMFQSKDGTTWNSRSIKYNKHLKVLNVYPDSQYVINHTGNRDYADTLKHWIASVNYVDDDGNDYITIDSVRLSEFNTDPSSYLTDAYDVLYVGTFNSNGLQDTNAAGVQAIKNFAKTGRGILFGHDVLAAVPSTLPYFNTFSSELGLNGPVSWQHVNGTDVKVVNNGFMMQYPYELSKNAKLTVPWTHNSQYFYQNISQEAIIWMTFNQVNYTSGNGDAPFYFATKNNYGMIQTADHRADGSIPAGFPVLSITDDECMILVNALYHFAQVTTETSAYDYTVSDEEKPVVDGAIIRCGSTGGINVLVEGTDKGSEYQWYIEAMAGGNTTKSDIVKEEIKSNIAGYFYEVSESATSSLASTVEGYKNEFGRITETVYKDPMKKGVLVAPEGNNTDYETRGAFSINESASSENYVHLVAVDRASNVSEVKSLKINDLVQPVNFAIERTVNEAKIVGLTLDPSISPTMKSMEIQVPKNTEIKDFDSLPLEPNWDSFENSATSDYKSYMIAMETNNSIENIKKLLEALRFTINAPVDNPGEIKLIFHEKVYTSWIDDDGVTHHYTFIQGDKTWFQSYNEAKKLRYKGLTGYMATITSEKEHNFIFDNIGKEPGWLGGTRAVCSDGSKLNDSATIPETEGDYDLNEDDWYWANGPEKGQVFQVGKDGGTTPAGAYSAFANGEPNNDPSQGAEYALQFAEGNNKAWHDLSGMVTASPTINNGYYVEFTKSGTQDDEITDRCWNAAIPQKVSLKACDEAGAAIPQGDILHDQALRIGDTIPVQEKTLEFYNFIRAIDMSNTDKTSYVVSNTYQEGKLIYSLIKRADLNIRQVIQNPNDELVIPKEGYLTIQNQLYNGGANTLDASYQINATISSDKEDDEPDFTKVVLSTSHLTDDNDEVQIVPIIPEFYKFIGYKITEDAASHTSAPMIIDDKISLSRLAISNHSEYWITILLEPNNSNSSKPQPYSWDYKMNDLGKMKTVTQ